MRGAALGAWLLAARAALAPAPIGHIGRALIVVTGAEQLAAVVANVANDLTRDGAVVVVVVVLGGDDDGWSNLVVVVVDFVGDVDHVVVAWAGLTMTSLVTMSEKAWPKMALIVLKMTKLVDL